MIFKTTYRFIILVLLFFPTLAMADGAGWWEDDGVDTPTCTEFCDLVTECSPDCYEKEDCERNCTIYITVRKVRCALLDSCLEFNECICPESDDNDDSGNDIGGCGLSPNASGIALTVIMLCIGIAAIVFGRKPRRRL